MRVIVLAAGTGSRLGEITRTRTKGMVPVNGKPLIDYLLEFLDLDSIEEVIIVGGFHYEDLKSHVDAKGLKNVRVIENSEYLKGNIFTLIRGLREFSGGSFLVTNVDHIYPRAMFERMKKAFWGITAMCDFDRSLGADDMKVKLNEERSAVGVISKNLKEFDCGYIGMTYVDASLENIYRKAVRETLKEFGEKAVVENILQVLAGKPETAPGICDLSGIGWYEVDTIDDLLKTEKEILTNRQFA